MTKLHLTMSAAYRQMFVEDSLLDGSYLGDVTPKSNDSVDMILMGESWFAIYTTGDICVPLVVEIVEDEPIFNEQQWDQIVKCSIDVPSGVLSIYEASGENDIISIKLPSSGIYGAMIGYADLEKPFISNGYTDDEGMFGDHYQLTLWKVDNPIPKQVVKYWANNPEA